MLRPVVEHARYDLAFEIGGRSFACSASGRARDDGAVIGVDLTSRLTPAGYSNHVLPEHEIDLVAVYCHELDRCYLLPMSLVAGRPIFTFA